MSRNVFKVLTDGSLRLIWKDQKRFLKAQFGNAKRGL